MNIFRKSSMRFFIISLVCLYSIFANAEDGCKLYPRITAKYDCKELLTIQENYHKYNKEMKTIALLRVKEIKLHLLDSNEQVDYIFNHIENTTIENIPIEIVNDIISTWKTYYNLPIKNKKEIIKYSLGMINVEQSEEVAEFIRNKQPFIIPQINNATNTYKK